MVALLGNIPLKLLIRNAFFSYLGRISYSLYLIHFIILMCFSGGIINFIEGFGIENLYFNQLLFVLVIAVSCFVLADFSERLIEKPCIFFGRYLTEFLRTNLSKFSVEIPGLKK